MKLSILRNYTSNSGIQFDRGQVVNVDFTMAVELMEAGAVAMDRKMINDPVDGKVETAALDPTVEERMAPPKITRKKSIKKVK